MRLLGDLIQVKDGCMRDGIKFDDGKPKIAMVLKYFGPAMVEVAKCGTFGCAKYGGGAYWDFNWNKVQNGYERYSDALIRHFVAEDSEVTDPDTGLLHAAHVAWNALARLTFLLAKKETRNHE